MATVILSVIQHFPHMDIATYQLQPQNHCLHLNRQFQRRKLLVK